MKLKLLTTTLGTVVLGAGLASAQDKPAAPAAAAPATPPPALTPMEKVDQFFNGKLPEAIAKGKFSLNVRLRYEFADQSNLEEGEAFTVRPRFGFTTAPFYGFQAMIEGEHISNITDDDAYNAAGSNGRPTKTIIADPTTTELNQAWVSYSNWKSVAKVGRQRIALDNHRFVGDVGWRQNMQTYDAITFENKSIDKLTLYYGYLWEAHRVFGDVNGLPAANQDFHSDSHLVNVSYAASPYAKFTGYSYLLDFDNSAANSTATYGGSISGAWNFDKDKGGKVNYKGEFAWQTDYGTSALNYEAEYYNLEVSADYSRYSAGVGYEVLGTDNLQGFRTPLATLHAFNGWADVFLATPARGLQDMYAFAQVGLPGGVPVRFVYHKYNADSGPAGDYGQEFNVLASKKLGKNWTLMAKYAYYDGKDAPFAPAAPIDAHKFWAQVEFNY